MKVAIIIEKEGTAIDRLAQMTVRAANWHEYTIVAVHPKRPNEKQLTNFEEALQWCDVVDFRYWKTAEMLRTHYAIGKPCMLSHYNPYDLTRQSWAEYQINVIVNKEQQMIIKHAGTLVPLPIDLDFWEFKDPMERQKTEGGPPFYDIIMVANRIEAKKGILPVAKLCGEKGYKMLLVGSVSDPEYFEQCVTAAAGNMTFQSGITDEELRSRYYHSGIHICNSIDNFESGTMPILEAMACGTPVITRRVGHVHDMFNGRNMMVRKSVETDTNELDAMIKELINTPNLRKEIAHEARASLRTRGLEYYGRQISKLYHKLRDQEENLVSVIVPTVLEPKELSETLAPILAMDVPKDMEVIVVDDSDYPKANEALVAEIRRFTPHTIKFYATALYTKSGEKTYGLARARNKAIMEAEGKWLMFVDDRLRVESGALRYFMERAKDNTWLWGVKDNTPKGFVENFSFIRREDLIRIGGFNEQITQYGGMTQEVRTRAEQNKIAFEMVEGCHAFAAFKSRSRWTKYSAIAKSKAQCYKLYG